MTERSRKYLFDILMAIDLIEVFIKDTKNFDSLANSIVWAILNRHLRPLKAEVLALTNIP